MKEKPRPARRSTHLATEAEQIAHLKRSLTNDPGDGSHLLAALADIARAPEVGKVSRAARILHAALSDTP
jgi:DNA-binding phage protein